VRRDYSSPAARALRQPRRAPRALISTLPAAAIYFAYAVRLGASARRAARRGVRRRLLRAPQLPLAATLALLQPRCAPRLLVVQIAPALLRLCRAYGRAVSPLDFSSVASRTLVVDYSSSPRLVVDYSTARLGASAHCAARHAARRTAPR
jgi:hypothetical protein